MKMSVSLRYMAQLQKPWIALDAFLSIVVPYVFESPSPNVTSAKIPDTLSKGDSAKVNNRNENTNIMLMIFTLSLQINQSHYQQMYLKIQPRAIPPNAATTVFIMKNLKLRDGGWSTSASAEKKLKNIIPVASFVNASNSIMVMNL